MTVTITNKFHRAEFEQRHERAVAAMHWTDLDLLPFNDVAMSPFG
jgi:hypothetical protein